jgi:hypothetical protein
MNGVLSGTRSAPVTVSGPAAIAARTGRDEVPASSVTMNR